MLLSLLALLQLPPCDSASVPVKADVAQRPGVAVYATSSLATARWYAADTVAGRCLGYVGATGATAATRSYVGWLPATTYVRSADTAVATREAAVRLLLARTGGLRVVDSTPAVVVLLDSVAGTPTVSSGIPLPPGRLFPGQGSLVHVTVNGFEAALATKELAGRHPDGSLRAVLVQFRQGLPAGATMPAVIRFTGGARDAAHTRALAETSAIPAAVLLPTDPAYLIATRLGGDLRPATDAPATALLAKFEADYVAGEATDWQRFGPQWNGGGRTAGYDRGFTLYQAWLRTGDPTYFRHALATVENYARLYGLPSVGIVPWYSESQGVALSYLLTGHEVYRGLAHKLAAQAAWQQRPGLIYFYAGDKGDNRARSRLLDALLDAAMIDASGMTTIDPLTMFSTWVTPRTLDTVVTGILKTQAANGAFYGTDYSLPGVPGLKAFMTGELLSSLIRYRDDVAPDDVRILPAVVRAADYLSANEWRADSLGFRYVTVAVGPEDQPTVQPSLNALVTPAYAWLWRETHDPKYARAVDEQLAGQYTARGWFMNNGKSWDQTFSLHFNVAAWRSM